MKENKFYFNNTYKSGSVTIIVFKEKKNFKGVCLEFDLITSAPTPKEALNSILDFTEAWLENVAVNHLSEELLNRPAPKKYWNIAKEIENHKARELQFTTNQPASKEASLSYHQNYTPTFPLAFA